MLITGILNPQINALRGITVVHEPHAEFKQRIPLAIGLMRTGDTTQFANVILESA